MAPPQSWSASTFLFCNDQVIGRLNYNMFVAVQALRGEGFLHEGQLPTKLPKLSMASRPPQSGKTTDMLPLTGRDPLMVEAAADFQDALLEARKSE